MVVSLCGCVGELSPFLGELPLISLNVFLWLCLYAVVALCGCVGELSSISLSVFMCLCGYVVVSLCGYVELCSVK